MSALEELRFAGRILNLRDSLPRAAEAVRRADGFLREHQIKGSEAVLVITGRGSNSPDGIPVIREEVLKLLHALRRQGVVAGHDAQNPGAFVVRLAPLRSLADAVPRSKDRPPRAVAPAISGLSSDTNLLLRALAERSLDELGVRQDEATIENEMHHHLKVLAPSLPGGADMEDRLRLALRTALAEYDR